MSETVKILVVDDVGESFRLNAILGAIKETGAESIVVKPDAPMRDEWRGLESVFASKVPVPTAMARRRKRAHYRREGFVNMVIRLSAASPKSDAGLVGK